jgi:DNA-binding beta-propeller fold protein YncE
MRYLRTIVLTMLIIMLFSTALTTLAQTPTITNIAASPPAFNSTNGGQTSINYVLNNVTNGNVTLNVTNTSTNTLVRIIPGGIQNSGPNSIIWDGKNNSNLAVPEGYYTANVSVAIGNSSQPPTFVLKMPVLDYDSGQFADALGVAVNSTGFIYVADSGNNTVAIFNSTGSLINALSVSGPRSVAINSTDFVYVVGSSNTVQVFDKNGNLVNTFGTFVTPYGVAINSTGFVYVTDIGTNSVSVFDVNGNLVNTFGTPGSGDGQFQDPIGVAINSTGFVYVADFGNNRVQIFDANGNFINESIESGYTQPWGIAINSSDVVYVSYRSGRVGVFDTNNNLVNTFFTGTSYGDAVDSSSNIYLAMGNRVSELSSSGHILLSIPNSTGQLIEPTGVAVNSQNLVYVVDSGQEHINVYDSNGSFEFSGFSLPDPIDDAINSSDFVYVLDRTDRVFVYNSNGNYIGVRFGTSGSGNGQFNNPFGIGINSTGFVYVADSGNNRIQVFDPVGNFITTFGTPGSGDGQFQFPTGVAINSTGYVYVADFDNNRVQVFDPSGNFITSFGTAGSATGQFIDPFAIAFDSADNVYVTDLGNNRVQEFDRNGNFITTFGTSGSGNGQFSSPRDIALDSLGNIYVADYGNNRVQKFAPSEIVINAQTSVLVDNTPPVITINVPVNGSNYILNQPVYANWNASDALSGIASTTATAPNNTLINTATLGIKSFTVTATDNASNKATKTVTYNVILPTVISVSPPNNATNVLLNTVIKATFNTNMSASTINNGTFLVWYGPSNTMVTGSVSYYAGNRTAVFRPSLPLGYGIRYTARITTGVRDIYGNHLASNYTWQFTTLTRPAVISTSPVNGATNVPLTSVIKATFNHTMNSSTINTNTFQVRYGWLNLPVAGTVTYYAGNQTAVFTPNTPLGYGVQYTATITTGVADTFGTHLPSNYVWSFTTLVDRTVSGITYVDVNHNYRYDPSVDPPLPGCTLVLVNTQTAARQTAVSNSQGQYSFTDLAPGMYVLMEQAWPGGYIPDTSIYINLYMNNAPMYFNFGHISTTTYFTTEQTNKA